MNSTRTYDVAIIGGGVIGLCCALHLLRGGQSVVVLEKDRVGAGASHGNCGTITPSHALPLAQPGMVRKALRWMLSKDAPFYVRPRFDAELIGWMLRFAGHCNWAQVRVATRDRAALLNLSRQLLEDLIRAEAIDCEFSDSGQITVYRDEKTFADSRHLETMLAEVDVPVEVWTGAQVEQREPALKPGVVAGHWYPSDAVIRPDRFVASLAGLVREHGGDIRETCNIDRFQRGSDDAAIAVVNGKPVSARRVLVCGGAWSPAIAAGLGIKVPIQPGKGYSITYDRPARAPSIPLVLRERSVCVTAWGSGFRLGSTMEFSGYDTSLNRRRLDALVRGAREYLHDAHGPNMQEEWYGWRPMTHDDLPIIGPSSRVPNLWFATGHGMLGMSMSVATGQCLADLMLGRKPAIATEAFAPSRFGM
jgi:D-amino-acid dehydrogenase